MKKLNEYITEEVIIESKGIETGSNEERKKELEKYLKGKHYSDYVATLNKMLEDDKAKILLQDGFGGELGDAKLKFKVRSIPVRNLRPTQSEIDVTKSVDFPLTKPENIENYYKNQNKCMIVMPLITFRGNYVIDGHHRWSQVFAFNPDAKMVCCDYDGDISPIQMLKATQGAIAAVKAETDGDKIPQNKVEGQNLFDTNWNEAAVKKHVKETAVDGVVDMFTKYKKELTDIDKIADFVAENLMDLKANNYPEKDAPNRGDMPQTDKGGKNADDKKSAMPDQEGSALNKLKDGKFDKDAVK